MTASNTETTRIDESEIESDDMKQVAVQKEAALLKKGTEVIEVERGAILKDSPANHEHEQGNDTSDIESGDEQGDSVIEIWGSRDFVVIYSANVDLSSDEQHESIEKKGNCTVIASAVQKLRTQGQHLHGFDVLFGNK
jgi:transcriptional regulator of NAD metabolism